MKAGKACFLLSPENVAGVNHMHCESNRPLAKPFDSQLNKHCLPIDEDSRKYLKVNDSSPSIDMCITRIDINHTYFALHLGSYGDYSVLGCPIFASAYIDSQSCK